MYVKDDVIWYETGDAVELIYDHPDDNDSLHAGDTGIVVSDPGVEDNSPVAWVKIRWDKPVANGHDADNRELCPYGYGWNVSRTLIQPSSMFNDKDTEYDMESAQELMSMLGVSA